MNKKYNSNFLKRSKKEKKLKRFYFPRNNNKYKILIWIYINIFNDTPVFTYLTYLTV
jgi:hypothetical protein